MSFVGRLISALLLATSIVFAQQVPEGRLLRFSRPGRKSSNLPSS